MAKVCGERSPLKVLHVITGLNDGGAEGALYRLCLHDEFNRHIVVSMMDAGKYGPLLQASGIKVHCLGMPRGKLNPRSLLILIRLLRDVRPDILQTWMYHADLIGGLIGWFLNFPVVWNIRHTTLDRKNTSWSTLAVAKLCAMLSRFVPKKIVACAKKSREVHSRLGYDETRIVVVPNGYDLSNLVQDKMARVTLRNEWGVPDDMPLFGMVARFDAQKDHANLISALAILRRQGICFKAIFVGAGSVCTNNYVMDRLADSELEDRVLLLGPRTDIPSVMNALDIHVLSSAYGEAFPNVLAESMACGTPCVSTDVGDAAIILGETGWIVPPRDSGALAEALLMAMRELEKEPEKWRGRQLSARERIIQSFSVEKMCAAYDEVWRGI